METMVIDGVKVEILEGPTEYDEKELINYVIRGREKFPNKRLERIKLKFDGENVEITYNFEVVPFERVRRVTGYLVGTIDRWNDATRAELEDRVNHQL